MTRRRSIAAALPRALRSAPRKVSRLRPDEVLLLILSPATLPLAAFALRRWGLVRVQAAITSRTPRRSSAHDGEAVARVERLSWCVHVAAAYGPWPANCLQRSVVLCWYLHRRGLQGELRIGVRRAELGRLEFHAWVEHEGVVVNDRSDVRNHYAVFDRPVAQNARFT